MPVPDPWTVVRDRLEAWLEADARASVGAPGAADVEGTRGRARGLLLAAETTEALDAAESMGALPREERAATEAQRCRAAVAPALESARVAHAALAEEPVVVDGARRAWLEAAGVWLASRGTEPDLRVGRALRGPLGALGERFVEARSAAAAVALPAGRVDGDPDGLDDAARLRADLEALLADTDAVVRARVLELGRGSLDPAALLGALARPLVAARERWRELGAVVRSLGLGPALEARVRLQRDAGPPAFAVEVVVRAAPGDVRLIAPTLDLGAVTDLFGLEGLVRAAMLASGSPALAPAFRWPASGTVSRALGVAVGLLLADRHALRWALGVGRREAELAARRVATLALLVTRLRAARGLARLEAREPTETARRALGVDVEPSEARLLLDAPGPAVACARAAVVGLELSTGLRERWDEDWYRNPRLGPVLLSAAARGGALSAEAWRAELGVPPGRAAARLLELHG